MDEVVGAVLPFVSVLFGAAFTYRVNVWQRRRAALEDLFTDAIAAMAAAEASTDYISQVTWGDYVTPEDLRELRSQFGSKAALAHIRKAAEARGALAKVLPYTTDLRSYYDQGSTVTVHEARAIIDELRKGPQT